jgi:hypothetical protein
MTFELVLIDEETERVAPETVPHGNRMTPAPVADRARETALLATLSEEAARHQLRVAQEQHREETESSRRHNADFKERLRNEGSPGDMHGRPGPFYQGGVPGWEYLNTETIAYVCGSMAAFAVFARNVVGTAKDWRDLRAGRKIKARLGSREIEIRDGTDLLALIEQERSAPSPSQPQPTRAYALPRDPRRRRPPVR